jgi:hypothetical protein
MKEQTFIQILIYLGYNSDSTDPTCFLQPQCFPAFPIIGPDKINSCGLI